MSVVVRLGLAALFLAWPVCAVAHSGSASYLRLASDGDDIAFSLLLDLQDVEYAIGVDTDRNGEITWGELVSQRGSIEAYVGRGLLARRGEQGCTVRPADLRVEEIAGGMYGVISGLFDCPEHGALELRSDLMFDLDTAHRALIQWRHHDATALAVLTNSQRQWREAPVQSLFDRLSAFTFEGMRHIWSGFDHLAFLLVLLLPAFMERQDGAGAIAWRKLIAIISTFTVAHSVTLALAVSGIVSAPERPVEIAIAVSVVVAALTNLFPRLHSLGVPTAFLFGLLHGFGFASALEGLGTTTSSFAVALAGFNLGVEVGQLAIVAAAYPVMHWLRTRPLYAARVVPIGSMLVAILGFVWVWERATA